MELPRQINPKRTDNTKSVFGRKALERIDLLLLTIESLDINSSQSMVWSSKQLGIHEEIPNSVELWKKRCFNPMRRSSRRGNLRSNESDALIVLIVSMADRIYPLLRQLLSSKEPDSVNTRRWNLISQRFTELVEERMNTRRGAVQRLMKSEYSRKLNRSMIRTLAFSSGLGGHERLKASLLDNIY